MSKVNALRQDLQALPEYQHGHEAAERGEPLNCWWLTMSRRAAWELGWSDFHNEQREQADG